MSNPASREIRRLELFSEKLIEAIDDFEHELRRCADAAERAGFSASQIEQRVQQLRKNRELNQKDLERTRRRIKELRTDGQTG